MATIPLITQPVSADKVLPALNALIDQINGFLSGFNPENVDIIGGTIANVTIDNSVIGGITPAAGNFTALTATSGSISGDTIVTRTAIQTLTNKSLTAPIISGGTINNAIIGGVTPAAATFTTATATTFIGALTGNAATATKLATARNINGVAFDGSADITVTAAAGTLTGGTLAAGVTASSLTSVGIITAGTWSGLFGAISGANLTNLTAANIAAGTANISILGNAATATTTSGNAATASKWLTARNLAGNSVDGSANVAFANKFIVQGTTDSGLSAAQFLGALGTGIVKNTTSTGVLSIAVAADFPTLNQSTTGNAATVTTNANLTGVIISVGNATSIASQTGTGTKFVVDNSPTLITPNIGVAVATSINFGGTTLSNYNEGSWTPIDTSGASLTFTSASGFYTRIGNLVIATGQAQYPVTVNAANAAIGGLPFSGGGTGKDGGQVLYCTITTLSYILMNAGAGPGTTASLFNSSGAQIQNSVMSGSTIYFQIIYHI